MYPQAELTALAARQGALRRRIAQRRTACAEAAGIVTGPLAWIDQALAVWRGISPLFLAAWAPLGLLLARTLAPRLKVLPSLLRWAPLAMAALRGLSRARSAERRSGGAG
jgi:hypothetical protein